MLNSYLIVDLPYDQYGIVTGYSDSAQYDSDKYMHLDLLGGVTNYISVIKAYTDSYRLSNVKSLLDCRDYFLSKALIATLHSALYFDDTKQSLTAHAYKSVSAVTTKAVYPRVLRERDQSICAAFGTLAYYFLFVKPDGYPSQYLNKLLIYVWGLLGLDYNTTPKSRLTKLYRLLGRTKDIDRLAAEAVKKALNAPVGSDEYVAAVHTRRNFITQTDAADFSLRVLTGKYSDELYPVFAAILSPQKYDQLSIYRNNVRSLFRPVGFNLLLNAFVTEGYLRAADYISGLAESQYNVSLDGFLNAGAANENQRHTIASHLATSYDALSFIETYNLFKPSESSVVLLDHIYKWTPPAVYAQDPTRLFAL